MMPTSDEWNIDPQTEKTIFGGSAHYYCFGRPHDWKLISNEKARNWIGHFLALRGINTLYFIYPNVDDPTIKVLAPKNFQDSITINSPAGPVTMYYGPGEGVQFPRGTAALIASRDCPTTIVDDMYDSYIALLHSGRDSCEDPAELGKESRSPATVFEALFQEWGAVSPEDLSAWIVCGISPCSFIHSKKHPQFGKLNEVRQQIYAQRGWNCFTEGEGFDLKELIRNRLIEGYGFLESQVRTDSIDTCKDINSKGERLWHSNVAGDKTSNGVLVINYG